ncbi:MAG: heavy metal translocating P-type ATPase metal-binding domain-containing protein, partial [Cyclobacteriaceae bacterium]|nr:heavy metal translocating P-type ATPase metal-binding domain-containing protein [Cyclobacteriaceae bacterium]
MSKESHAVHAEKEDSCYHCGEACREDAAIAFDGHVFCCTGCQSVYDILQQADLCDFYALDERTGKVRNQEQHSYRVLDDLDTARQFVEFEHDGIARVTFFSPAIHCSSCIWLLEHLGRVHKGVIQSQVNFLRKEVTVTYHTDQLSLKEVALLLDQVGYAPRIESRKNTGKKRNDLVVRLAVAGFCFGNSMLISIPDYLDMKVEIPDEFQRWFGYINLLFALPVFFYSSSVYFQSAWKGLKHRFVTIDVPVSLGIIALFVRSVVEITVFGELGYVDSLAGLVFFLLIGRWYQHKTYQALSFDRDLASYFPIAVSKIVESNEVTTKLAELVEGDLIRIRNQELIPADGVLEKGIANIDYSFVTGESVPSFHEKGSLMYAGGRQLGGPIEMKLTKKVNNSHLTRLWNQDNEEKEDNKLHNLSDRISQSFTLIILFLAFGAAAYWFFADPSLVVNVFTSILIVACPCALALAVPFTYGHTLRMFGHRGFYLKNANVIEKIAGIQRIVFDKTGTLTSPLPEQVSFVGHELNDQVVQWVYTAASNSIHPLSKILSNRYQDASLTTIERFEEIAGKGLEAVMEGHTIRLGSASWVLAGDVEADNRTKVYLGLDGTYLGYFLFSNVYRPGIFEMLENLTTSHRL